MLIFLVKLVKNGTATQSTTYSNFHAGKAVDGDYSQSTASNCAHQGYGRGIWRYTLPYTFVVESVEVYSLIWSYSVRLSYCNIVVSNAATNKETYCGNTGDMYHTANRRIICEKPLIGNEIVISCNQDSMTMCEMDIFGKILLKNL